MFYAYQTGYEMLDRIAKAKAYGVAVFGRAILEHIMLEGKADHLRDALELAISSRQAAEILILRNDGTIAMSATQLQNDSIPPELPLSRFRETKGIPGVRFLSVRNNGISYEYIVMPIIKKRECLRCHTESEPIYGYLAAKISVSDLQAIALHHRTANTLATIFIFVGLGGVIYVSLLFLVIRPVKKLRSEMQKVENQADQFERGELLKFTSIVVPERQDEITDLILSFNALINRLNDAHDKLRQLHQAQLGQADRLATAGEIATSIAHEIKNPVAGVLGALQIISAETSEDDARKEIVLEMIVQLERINQTINNLLSYARPGPPVFEATNLNEVVKRTLSFLQPQINTGGINSSITLEDNLPEIVADQKMLQQVFLNILLNAVQAMQSGGTLSISTSKENGTLKVQITDIGKGISPEIQREIFKPFFTTKHKGTGLGLAICKRIVEQHNGTISVKSEMGKGTTFTISLPIQPSEMKENAN